MANKTDENVPQGKGSLTIMGFFAITASMVMAAYEYPTFATSGFHLVFFLIVAGFLWFIPVALCAAEMATTEGWEEGGIFTWSSQALGKKWGFAHIFFQWFEISVGFTPMLYYIVGALSYLVGVPALNTNPVLKLVVMLIIFWGLTFSQFGGTKYTATISKLGFLIGIVIPSVVLILMGIWYAASGHPIHVQFNAAAFMPDFSKVNTLVVFVTFILAYMGVEASAVHVHEMKNPKRDYPITMLILVIVAILLNTFGGLSIAAAVPASQINLSAGVVQTFTLIGGLIMSGTWYVKILAFLMVVGVAAEVSAWVVGPSHGMHVAAKQGIIPQYFSKVNSHEIPVRLIVLQGFIVSFWFAVLTLSAGTGGGNMSFLTSMSLTVVIYLAGYLIFFVAYFSKIFRHKDLQSSYQVPGGQVGKCIVAGVGLLLSVIALVISFVPPSSLTGSQARSYELILVIGWVVVLALPFIIFELYKSYKKSHNIDIAANK
ncbi:MAG: amino acid permease [Sarcina sp.]